MSAMPPAPGLGQPTPGSAPNQQGINDQLLLLWQRTGDASILQYISSGWTTPVSLAVQAEVSRIVGRQVPTTTPGGMGAPQGPGGSTLPPAPTPPGQGAQGGARDNLPGVAGYNDTPVPDPTLGTPSRLGMGLAYGGASAGLNGIPGGSGGPLPVVNPPQPINDPLNPFNPANRTPEPPSQAQTTAPPSSPKPGGNAVNPPAPPTPGSTPFDPNGVIGQQNYVQAMRGDPKMLGLVLGKLLSTYGIDVTRPGLNTANLVQLISPYLKTFLNYYGVSGEGEPAFDKAKQAANEFGALLGGPGTFGKIQDYGRGVLGSMGGILGNARGDLADPNNQQAIVNDIMGMLTAGDNQIRQASLQGQLLGTNYDYGQATFDEPGLGYIDFLRRQATAGKLPGGDLLAQILGSAGR